MCYLFIVTIYKKTKCNPPPQNVSLINMKFLLSTFLFEIICIVDLKGNYKQYIGLEKCIMYMKIFKTQYKL